MKRRNPTTIETMMVSSPTLGALDGGIVGGAVVKGGGAVVSTGGATSICTKSCVDCEGTPESETRMVMLYIAVLANVPSNKSCPLVSFSTNLPASNCGSVFCTNVYVST